MTITTNTDQRNHHNRKRQGRFYCLQVPKVWKVNNNTQANNFIPGKIPFQVKTTELEKIMMQNLQ